MESSGIAFGSHTVTHALLGQVDRASDAIGAGRFQDRARPIRQASVTLVLLSQRLTQREACELARQFYDGAVTVRRGLVDKTRRPLYGETCRRP